MTLYNNKRKRTPRTVRNDRIRLRTNPAAMERAGGNGEDDERPVHYGGYGVFSSPVGWIKRGWNWLLERDSAPPAEGKAPEAAGGYLLSDWTRNQDR